MDMLTSLREFGKDNEQACFLAIAIHFYQEVKEVKDLFEVFSCHTFHIRVSQIPGSFLPS